MSGTKTTWSPVGPQAPTPTAEQLTRLEARKRFNRLFVHFPMLFFGVLWFGIIIALLWLTVAGEWFAMDTNRDYFRSLVSGIADFIVILALLPTLVLCLVPIALPIGLVVYRRQRRAEQTAEPEKLPLMWRIENIIARIQSELETKILPRLAQPVVSAHAIAAYCKELWLQIKKLITEIRFYGK